MSAVVTTPEEITNNALVRIGQTIRIGNMYDGSKPAKLALDIYGQTRDMLLREGNWQFARRDLLLTLLKTAPADYVSTPWTTAYPPVPFLYEYTYPDDCLKLRSIKPPPLFTGDYTPAYHKFTIYNDNTYTPAKKTIVCNVANALAVYTAQVTSPATWEVGFVEAMIAGMARRLAPAMADLNTEKAEAADEQGSVQSAEQVLG